MEFIIYVNKITFKKSEKTIAFYKTYVIIKKTGTFPKRGQKTSCVSL